MPFLIILGIIAMICLISILRVPNQCKQMQDLISCACVLCFLALMIGAWWVRITETPDFQYVPAEYIAENETSTYFGTEDGNIFYVDRIPLIDKNILYLLGMDTKGTSDVTDDEILTVWRLCE